MAYFSRGLNKLQNPYTIKDFYKRYINECENDLYKIEYGLYSKIVCDYLKGLVEYMFETSLPFKLPHKLGNFQIIKKIIIEQR